MIVSALLFLCAVVIFTGFDVWGFGDQVQGGKLDLKIYRALQLALQFSIYAALFFTAHYGALAGFILAHWGFGCDWLYYVWRGEDFSEYLIVWFKMSLPSLVFDLINKPFTGKQLRWIGPSAIAAGLIVAMMFA